MFIQRATASIFAFTFIKTLLTSSATANRTLMALIYTIDKKSFSILSSLSFFEDTSCLKSISLPVTNTWTDRTIIICHLHDNSHTFELNYLNLNAFKHWFCLTLSQTSAGFYVSAFEVFWKHCWKRRNCSYRAISPFPTVISPIWRNFCHFHQIWNVRLQTLSVWMSLKCVVWERANVSSCCYLFFPPPPFFFFLLSTKYCNVYLVIELNGITDNVTKIKRQKSYTKFYNLINQSTVINDKI